MQQAPASTHLQRRQVGKLILYITPQGELVMVSGNQHMRVSPQEAQEHFDYLLGHAELFRRHVQSTINTLVPSQNRVNA